MKITVGALRSALSKAQKIGRTAAVTLQGSGTHLTIHAAGQQGCAKATIAIEDGAEFVALIDGNRLSAVLGGADAALECTISQSKEAVRLKFGQANIRFPISTEAESTLLEESRWEGAVSVGKKISGAVLKEALDRVTSFAARNDSRYYLNGVLMTVRDGCLTLVATDGFRLARLTTSIEVEDAMDSIIPITIADAMAAIIDGDADVQICTVGENESRGIGFRSNNLEVMCPVIAGAYPKFEKVVPRAESMATAVINRKAALAALEMIAAVADAKSGVCYIKVAIADKTFTVMTTDEESRDLAELESPVEVPMSLGFQPKLLVPAIAAVKTDNVCLSYTKPDVEIGKVLVRDAEGDDWSVVVMPSRT